MSEWIRELILGSGEVAEAPSRYKDDLAYWLDGREIAHFESDEQLDLRLTRKVISQHRDALKADPRVELRSGSDWVTVKAQREDTRFLAQLVGWAIEANRRPTDRGASKAKAPGTTKAAGKAKAPSTTKAAGKA